MLAVILAAWQVGSVLVGPYWLSSPWAVAARFTAQILNGELIVQGGYTVEEALIGTVIGGAPAVLLPFLLRRHPVIVAILDPFMVGGYGAPKLAFAPLFILWFGIGIESKIALVASVVFFIVYFNTLAGVRALDPRLVQMAQIAGAGERHVARHIVFPARRPAYSRRLSYRGALRHRRRGHRRADLVQSRARLSGADRRDELRHHLGVRRDPRRHPHRPWRQLAAQRRRAGAAALAAAAAGRARHRDLSMSDPPLLDIRSLGKRFPARHGREPSPWVIQDLSFSVGAGEFLTIIGPSGAGKSTLLNMIAQIDTASAGEIMFNGETVNSHDARTLRPGFDRRIGYVTQDDNLLPWRTTIDNVLFPIEVQGRLNDATRAQADVLVRAVGLAGFERYYPHELSGGMRKRAALIRTLAYDPPVILMDEPFAAVDAQTRTQLQADLLTLWGLGRKTIIFVTHDITEAIALGDRALVLSRQPTRIAAEHAIPIPRPRNVQDIFALEGFAAVYQRIRADIQ